MKRIFSFVFAVLALSQITGALANQPAVYPKMLSQWVISASPKESSATGGVASWSKAHWEVFMQQGQPCAVLHVVRTGHDKRSVSSVLPFQIKPSHDFSGIIFATKANDGWIVGSNRGEWGGSLWWFSSDGIKHYKISDDEVDQLLTTDAGVVGLETLTYGFSLEHPDPKTGEILRLVKSAQGTWQAVNYVYLSDAPEVAMQGADGSLVVVTSHGLLRVDRNGRSDVLLTGGFWGGLQLTVTSIIRDTSGEYFVGMRAGVTRIRQSGKAYRAEWLQPTKTFVHDNRSLFPEPMRL